MELDDLDLTALGSTCNPDGLVVLRPGEGIDEDFEDEDREGWSPAERAAILYFHDNEDAIYEAMLAELQQHVAELEEEGRREAERLGRGGNQRKAVMFGDAVDVEHDGGSVAEQEVRELFDDPEELDSELEDLDDLEAEEEPFWTRFTLKALVLVPGRTRDRAGLGFVGDADWDVEHGLGVIMEGTEVEEIGGQSLVLGT